MRFKNLISVLLAILCVSICFPVCADENKYVIRDNAAVFIEEFETYKDALKFYNNHVGEYDNLLLYENDKLIRMEYGVVKFNNNQYIDYYSLTKEENDILSSAYGVDAAYLSTNNDDDVYFKIAGDKGFTNIDNVTLVPFEELKVKTSLYHTDGTYLYHNIKTQLDYEHYSSCLKIDFIPDFLDKNDDYYSYDGHYFYNDFYKMIDDYLNETYENAVNEEPYYNYFQYLPYRTLTNYDYVQMEDYLYNTLSINGRLTKYDDLNMDSAADEINRSELYGLIDDFYAYQNIYGANALMLIASAIDDSSYGKSQASFINNNLYNTSAYDTSLETNNERYDNVTSSIYAHAKYFVSYRYSNYRRDDYCGTFAGDRYSGITSAYSLDQYNGERLASKCFEIDNKLGLLDYNANSIAIVSGSFDIYNDESLSEFTYRINNDGELAFVILDETEETYLIQLDYTNDTDYIYDYETCVGYINKDVVKYVINADVYQNNEYVKVTYDFNDGSFIGKDSLVVKTKKGSLPAYIEPSLDGYEFTGYENFDVVDTDTTFAANYKEISEIVVNHLFDKPEDLYPTIDLSNAYIIVKYADGTNKKLPITTDMLSYIDTSKVGEQEVTITYCGLSVNKTITIDDSVSSLYKDITNAINEKDYDFVKKNIKDISYPFTMSMIRDIDNVLRQFDNRNYVINDNTNKYDVSISGLDLSLDDLSSFSFFKDTYYAEIKDIKSYSLDRIKTLASGYDFEPVCGINISFKFNFQKIDLNGPAIVQIDIADKQANNIYTVYHINNNGDIIKCRTTHTNNCVEFMIEEAGDYLVLSKPSLNEYNIEDGVEMLSYENMGYDNHRFNLNVLFVSLFLLMCLIGVIVYYIIKNKKDYEWKDYRKSLQKVDTVLEEKPKN